MENSVSIYNSLTRKKEVFQPLNPPFVGLYVCGPTVYNDVHLGNVRTFITFDVVYRYLSHIGYKVRYVRNITDVGHLVDDADEGDDKIEKRARLEKLEPMEIVQKYTNSFHATTKLFNLKDPSIEPTATAHIIEQIEMIKNIIDNGLAYIVNGSVYFDVKKYMQKHNYGKLSGRKVEELFEQTRENLEGGKEKKYFADFALWKKASPNTIMKWPSPWSVGVPGWHLECSVMSTKYLGETFDIHGGGMDLKFPHHECEIAQSVGASGKEPARYWMHGNMLTVNGAKMSKSLGNSFLPMELITGEHPLLEKPYSPMTIRFFFLQAHYGSTVDFSNEALSAAEKGFKKLQKAYLTLQQLKPVKDNQSVDIDSHIQNFYKAMNDDFNTPVAIAHLFDLVKIINLINDGQASISTDGLKKLNAFFKTAFFDILGLIIEEKAKNDDLTNELINLILTVRLKEKQNKNWELADFIRDELKKLNIIIKDAKDTSTWEYNH